MNFFPQSFFFKSYFKNNKTFFSVKKKEVKKKLSKKIKYS